MEIALFILAPIVALGSLALISISKPKSKPVYQKPKCTHNKTKVIHDYWFTEEIQITACVKCGKVLKTEHI